MVESPTAYPVLAAAAIDCVLLYRFFSQRREQFVEGLPEQAATTATLPRPDTL